MKKIWANIRQNEEVVKNSGGDLTHLNQINMLTYLVYHDRLLIDDSKSALLFPKRS